LSDDAQTVPTLHFSYSSGQKDYYPDSFSRTSLISASLTAEEEGDFKLRNRLSLYGGERAELSLFVVTALATGLVG
jgi:hypothetical protein